MSNGSKTRKGDREIISVSLPLDLYDKLQMLCEHYDLNRSSFVASAISEYLQTYGVKVREP